MREAIEIICQHTAINLAKRNLTMNFDTPSRGIPEVIFIPPANERVVECSHQRGHFDCSGCSRRRDQKIGHLSRRKAVSRDMPQSGRKSVTTSRSYPLWNATNQGFRECESTSDAEQGQNRPPDVDVAFTKSTLFEGSDTEQASGNSIMRRSGSEGMMSLSSVAGLVSKLLEDAIDQGALSMSTQSFPPKEKVTTTGDQIPDQHVPSE